MYKTISLISLALLSLAAVQFAVQASGYEREYERGEEHGEGHEKRRESYGRPDLTPLVNEQYQNECGACHMAYQPGLLPADSWNRVMDTVEDHYGEDASLDPQQVQAIRQLLLDQAADRSSDYRARAFARTATSQPEKGEAAPRITQSRYFVREHDEIPRRFVTDNPKVASFSQCQACHQGAEKGVYDEHDVRIPGVGRWDD